MKNFFYCIFFLIIYSFIHSCNLDRGEDTNPIHHQVRTDLIRNVFLEGESAEHFNEVHLDSLIQLEDADKSTKSYLYLANLHTLLYSSSSLEELEQYFTTQINAENFHLSPAYLKFSIHYYLSLIFAKQNYYLLELKEIMLAVSHLEETEGKHKEEIALGYQEIGFVCYNYLGDSEKSTFAYEKALEIYAADQNYKLMYYMTYNLSLQFYGNEDYLLAKEYAEKTIEVIVTNVSPQPKHLWTSIYPVYIRCMAALNQSDGVIDVYQEARQQFELNNISSDVYDEFNYSILEALALLGFDTEFEYEFNRLMSKQGSGCEYIYPLSHIYRGLTTFQKIHKDVGEYETQVKRLENVNCDNSIEYYRKEYLKTINRLIEIAEQTNRGADLNKWYKMKLTGNEGKANKEIAYAMQLDFWYEQDLRYVKKEVLYQNQKIKFLRAQALTFGGFAILLLLLIVKIVRLLKNIKLKNNELSKSYLIQEKQKLELEENNKIIETKNSELVADLKTHLLLASNNSKVFDKLKSEVDKKTDLHSLRYNLKAIIRTSQNESIWKEVDQKFLYLNDHLFKVFSEQFPKLTKNDLKLCALIKMNLSNKEIARIQYQSAGSIKVSRSRLKKKLGIQGTDISLLSFINSTLINNK